MSVEQRYYDELGNPYWLFRDEQGFWQSRPDPDPIHYETTFTDFGSLDTTLTIQINGDVGDWFQIDNVALYGTDSVDDTYSISVREYNDAGLTGDPQLYNEISEFPNPLSEILVPVNEFVTYTSFNTILGKIQENFEYLIDKSKFLSVPPNYISFRYGESTYSDYNGRNVWMQADNGFSKYWGYDSELNVDYVAGLSNAMVYVANNVLYAVDTLSGADPLDADVTTPPNRGFYVYGDDVFTDIKAISVDSNGYTWVLDDVGTHTKIGVFEYDVNWSFKSSWNVTNTSSKKYIQNPTDLKIKDGAVYISCDSASVSGGVEIRVFNEVGSYMGSMSYSDLTSIESIAITTDYIIALSDNKLYKFDMDYSFVEVIDLTESIFTYDYENQSYNETVISGIFNNATGVFFYGIAGNQVYKFGQSGNILESFGKTAVNYINSTIGDSDSDYYPEKNITGIFHDEEFNLYVSSDYDVVRYYDRAEVFDRLLDDLSFSIDDCVWETDQLDVGPDENATAWVYNRVFDRIIDNLNIFRLALKGPQALISTNTFEYVVTSNFKPSEYVPLDYEKGDIAIGINELHCEASLNRCIRQIHECFDTCLGYINVKDSGLSPDSLIIGDFELVSQSTLPMAEYINGVYYFDYGRTVSNLSFKWSDNVVYRSDPSLRAYITTPSSSEIALSRFPTPTTYYDENSYDNGNYIWTLRETYETLEKSATVNVQWSKRIFAGIMPDGVIPDSSDVINYSTWSSLNPTIEGYIPSLDVSSGDKWFIAVPADEWDAQSLTIVHPDYDDMIYDFDGDNKYTLVSPDFGYGSLGVNYYVFSPSSINYSEGITEINFKLVRT